jgi:hypothetical protein
MVTAFGCAWPVAIYKSYTSRSNKGKSLFFLLILTLGYIAGLIHKILYNYDIVLFLYAANLIMISIEIFLYFRNKKLMKKYDTTISQSEKEIMSEIAGL